MQPRKSNKVRRKPDPAIVRFFEAERLFQEARELNPYPFRPFVKSFNSFEEYERWRRVQKDPWYR